MTNEENREKPTALVLASTYPRWRDDHEPGFIHELCRRLTQHFHVIALVPDAPGATPSGVMDGVEVIRYRYAPRKLQTLVYNGGVVTNLRRSRWKWLLVPGFVLGQYWTARRLMGQRKIDVIHAHWLLPQGLVARHLSRLFSVAYVVTSHGGDLFGLRGHLLTRLKRHVAANAAAMTVVSTAMRDEVTRLKLQPPEIAVLPMGVDLQERFIPDMTQTRSTDRLLFVGRLVPKKGLTHLLDALPTMIAKRPSIMLDIVGFGPEEDTLRAKAKALGVEAHINFVGPTRQQDLPAMYQRAALFVAPFIRDDSGNQEGLPVVLMEAIGCGCPVVVGDVAGVHDLLGEAAREVCIQPENTAALADTIVAALDDPTAAAKRAAAIREIAARQVDWQRIADGYAAILRSGIGRLVQSKSEN